MAQDQIVQKRNELKAASSTRAALAKNVELMKKENAIRHNLAVKGYGSQLMALESERQLNQLQGQLQEAGGQENRAAARCRKRRTI